MTRTLGIDVGTQGTKAVVIDSERAAAPEGAVVARAAAAYDLIEGLPPGCAEQHPSTWIDAIESVRDQLATQVALGTVEAVAISGQQHGLVVLDDADQVVRPAKLWCDTSTAAEASELSAVLGRAVPTGFTAPKVLWMQRNEPERWARVRRVLLPHDYVNWRLTGRATMEAGDASGTGFFDVRERRFDADALHAIGGGLEECLPDLVPAGGLAGELSAAGAALLGTRAGLPVATGGGDNMMSAIGSGATSPGAVVVSLGTSGTAFTYCPDAIIDPEGAIAAFCDSTGGWLPLLCVMNMTGVAEEVVRGFGGTHDELSARAETIAAGCDGLLLLPYLSGERVPDLPAATGSLLGLRPGLLSAPHLYRAALEGTSLNLGRGIDRMRRLGIEVDRVRVVGGAARNPLWRRILASVLDAPVARLVESESAALGAALQALWTLRGASSCTADEVAREFVREADEVTEPVAGWREPYRDALDRLADLTATLHGRN